MKKRRRIKPLEGGAIYHCISRVVGNEHLWNDRAKETMRGQLWRAADFSGVEILTYCLMSNHFHVLVRVPDRARVCVSDEELLRRYRSLYIKEKRYGAKQVAMVEKILHQGGKRAQVVREQLLARMHDVSEFMKTFKQRFSVWYNRTHRRQGTHWSERFKSVLVEGTALAARTVAAYIDLNPVRAGLVADPKDYRWCGYAEAVGGKRLALAGIRSLLGYESHPPKESPGDSQAKPRSQTHEPSEALACYRILLFGKGVAPAKGKVSSGTISQAAAFGVMKKGGHLSLGVLLRCRMRYFTDGLVLGSKTFVNNQLDERLRRGEIRRRPKALPLTIPEWGELEIARKLRH